MVNKQEIARMRDFIQSSFQSSGYGIEKEFAWGAQVKDSESQYSAVLIHSGKLAHKEMFGISFAIAQAAPDVPIIHILNGDGKNGLVRLAERGNWKGDRSLSRYSKEEIDKMIHLRGNEKVLRNHPITYFRPESAQRPNRFSQFMMGAVQLDYSHLGQSHHGYGFAKNKISTDYVMPQNLWEDDSGLIQIVENNNFQFIIPK